jgi:hypothetical protein
MAKNTKIAENSRAAHRLKRRTEALRANLRRRKDAAQNSQDRLDRTESPEPAPNVEPSKFTTPR